MLAVLRADASASVGGGHVARCTTIAAALAARGWSSRLATANPAGRPVADGIALPGDAAGEPAALRAALPGGCDLLVVDHYGRDADFERACRPWARRILAIDDAPSRRHDSNLLLDPAPGRATADYERQVAPGCVVLAGAGWAPLRSGFARRRPLPVSSHRRLYVGFGATDPTNATGRALRAVARAGIDAAVDVVLGPDAPHLDAIRQLLAGMPGVRLHVGPPDVAAVLHGATLAIGAGGVSALERCALGVPSLIVPVAANQNDTATGLARAGAAALAADEPSALAPQLQAVWQDAPRREAMRAAALALCDGLGAPRIAATIAPLRARDGAPVVLRPAGADDTGRLLDWRSHPAIRRWSRNTAAPDPAAHARWFAACRTDPRCVLQIVLHGGAPAGVVRLDAPADYAQVPAFEVSIMIDPERQRLGLAAAALALAAAAVPWAGLRAEVLPGNRASHAMFAAAGYVRVDAGRYALAAAQPDSQP